MLLFFILWSCESRIHPMDDHFRYSVCVVYLSARLASVVFLRLCLCHSPASDISRKSSIEFFWYIPFFGIAGLAAVFAGSVERALRKRMPLRAAATTGLVLFA